MGDFLLALEEKKTLVCPVISEETCLKAAMVMYHFDDEDFIFKNSDLDQPITQVPITNYNPKIGYYIRF